MTRPLRVCAFAALLALPVTVAFAGGEPWENEPAFKSLVRFEKKQLESLLDIALKKDYRRQAWYFAQRLTAVDPMHDKAMEVLDRWTGAELVGGKAPSKPFVKKRDGMLRGLGDQYFHFGEMLEASGMDPEKYYPINVRAHAYGSKAGNLLTALRQADYVWLGTFGPQPRAEIEKCLQAPLPEFAFPEEFEDPYLQAKALWPEARGAQWQAWRLLTDHDYKETLRLLGILSHAEAWMARYMGSRARRKIDRVTNLLVFGEWQKYDKVGADMIREEDRERFEDTSGWHDLAHGRLLVCWRHRFNGWLGDDDLMLGHAAKVMARRHFARGAGGGVSGRGAWLLEGLRGAFEGFRLNQDGKGEIDPGSCWRLSVARALRSEKKLVPWDDFLQMDRTAAEKVKRVDVQIKFGGAFRDAKQVDVVAAQATALVVGLMKAERGRGLKKLGALLGELIKKNSVGDIDKAMGLKPGRAAGLAEVAIDAAHGLANR
jgi:hypothetical protein